jgi:hypothetical protein
LGIERVEALGVGFHEDGSEEVPAAMSWEIEGPEFMHLVDDRFDDDVVVLQDGPFRFAVTVSLVLDDVEFGQSTEVLADRALVAVETAREVADRLDLVPAAFEVSDELEPTLGEDVAAVLPTEYEDVRIALCVEVAGELFLPQNSLWDAAIRSIIRIGFWS